MNVIVFGANGRLGRHLIAESNRLNFNVTAFVRNGATFLNGVPGQGANGVAVKVGDATDPQRVFDALTNNDAAIIAAGNPGDPGNFIRIVDTVVTHADRNSQFGGRLWMLGGAALLDIPSMGRNSIGVPGIPSIFEVHQVNYDRIRQSQLDWSVLCPGPMVESKDDGYFTDLRISTEELPFPRSDFGSEIAEADIAKIIANRLPELIVPYRDAANLVVRHLKRSGMFSGKRVGIALPAGMTRERRRLGQ
jgi:uncharacterized protein